MGNGKWEMEICALWFTVYDLRHGGMECESLGDMDSSQLRDFFCKTTNRQVLEGMVGFGVCFIQNRARLM